MRADRDEVGHSILSLPLIRKRENPSGLAPGGESTANRGAPPRARRANYSTTGGNGNKKSTKMKIYNELYDLNECPLSDFLGLTQSRHTPLSGLTKTGIFRRRKRRMMTMKTLNLILLTACLLATSCTSAPVTSALSLYLSCPAVAGQGTWGENLTSVTRLVSDCRRDGMPEAPIRRFLLTEPQEATLYSPIN